MIDTIIKVGGSLGKSPDLRNIVQKMSTTCIQHKVLLVPGGGLFADAIRNYDNRLKLTPDAAHWMSILGMDQFGHLICSLLENGTLVRGFSSARKAFESDQIPVLLPYDILFETDVLPRNWDVTSDSIAAWLAKLAGARQLILLKSVDGLFSEGEKGELLENAEWSSGINNRGALDNYFLHVLKNSNADTWLINGNYPERLEQLLQSGTTIGTRLLS